MILWLSSCKGGRNFRFYGKPKALLIKNKEARKEELESLLEFVKTQIPTATTKDVNTKIGTIRGTYRTERNKVLKSMRSGVAADQIYKPSLWYYSQLSFLDDHLEARESLSILLPRRSSSLSCSQAQPSLDEQPEFLEEHDFTIWSQAEHSKDEGGEMRARRWQAPMAHRRWQAPVAHRRWPGLTPVPRYLPSAFHKKGAGGLGRWTRKPMP
ncbi:bis(5'-adenosyl)-triphosphatase isoform X1 [Rana temporaria]|uniref:bis(5'-adenosyl)-triphosphatase isoform X1 n=1 Tax=Rana temporaria TaxID=8407 RepID=UPI001AAD20ED|nr:bis(5'-adenosyl)-triphosphatase isoform X1 [Rana temporaria]